MSFQGGPHKLRDCNAMSGAGRWSAPPGSVELGPIGDGREERVCCLLWLRGQCTRRIRSKVDSFVVSQGKKERRAKGLERRQSLDGVFVWVVVLHFVFSSVSRCSFGFSSIRGRSCRRCSLSFHHHHFLTPRVKSSHNMLATAKLNDENANTRNTRWPD